MLSTASPQALNLITCYAQAFNSIATYNRAAGQVELRAPEQRDHRAAPWVALLDEYDLAAFAADLQRDLVFAHQTGDTAALEATVAGWSALAHLLTFTDIEPVEVVGTHASARLLVQVLELV